MIEQIEKELEERYERLIRDILGNEFYDYCERFIAPSVKDDFFFWVHYKGAQIKEIADKIERGDLEQEERESLERRSITLHDQLHKEIKKQSDAICALLKPRNAAESIVSYYKKNPECQPHFEKLVDLLLGHGIIEFDINNKWIIDIANHDKSLKFRVSR